MARPNQAPHRGHPDAPAHWTRADPWRARHELGQRKRVAHIPTAETEAARSGLILEGHGQASLHFKFNPSWSYEWGPVQRPRKSGRNLVANACGRWLENQKR